MSAVYRLLFFVFVYYTVTGIYLQAYFSKLPFVPGFVGLLLALMAFGIVSGNKKLDKFKKFTLLFPLAAVAFLPDWVDCVHILPAWLYSGYVLLTDKTDMDYAAFSKRLVKILLIFGCALIIPILGAKPVLEYLSKLSGYFVLILAFGAICLRSLRNRDQSLHQFGVIAVFTIICGVLCLLGIPQTILGFLRDKVLMGIIGALGYLASFINIRSPETEQTKTDGEGYLTKPDTTNEIPFDVSNIRYKHNMQLIHILETLFYIAVGILLLVLLIKLVKGMIKELKQTQSKPKQFAWQDEVVHLRTLNYDNGNKRRRKSRDPRNAVRYYYWLYMQECAKRGIAIEKGWTSEDLAVASSDHFLQEDILAMQALYMPVRYNDNADVTQGQARQAAKLWHKLKKSNKI